MKSKGVYFLANDKVYELAIAFLNSFRNKNKDIDLCLIPFDDKYERISKLGEEYNFTIYANKKVLDECDAISTKFHSKPLGAYRKLATWEGIFDEFAYIDIDTVVLGNVDFAFDYLKYYPVFTSHSNIPSIVRWVWKDTIFQKNVLTDEQIQFGANTGFFVSTRKLLPIEWVGSKVSSALELKDDMELFCMEQPFLNYLIVTSGYKFSSLSKMLGDNIAKDVPLECWAGTEGGVVDGGDFHIPNRPEFFLVHWAGLWQESFANIPYRGLWLHYRNLRVRMPEDMLVL